MVSLFYTQTLNLKEHIQKQRPCIISCTPRYSDMVMITKLTIVHLLSLFPPFWRLEVLACKQTCFCKYYSLLESWSDGISVNYTNILKIDLERIYVSVRQSYESTVVRKLDVLGFSLWIVIYLFWNGLSWYCFLILMKGKVVERKSPIIIII